MYAIGPQTVGGPVDLMDVDNKSGECGPLAAGARPPALAGGAGSGWELNTQQPRPLSAGAEVGGLRQSGLGSPLIYVSYCTVNSHWLHAVTASRSP